MSFIRKIAFPFSFLYGVVTLIRNKMFDLGILKSTQFDIPIIVVGNLSVGGTGKTPQIEYLIRLLKQKYGIAVLSRGYGRKTSGFILANESSNVHQIGDEPFQYFKKFNDISVVVDEKRVNGIEELLQSKDPPNVILLDDAFQHRSLKSNFNILLTAYNDLYCDDFMLPTGNLREYKSGSNRAQIVIVTKCPLDLSEKEQNVIEQRLNLKSNQQLFFSGISYEDSVTHNEKNFDINNLKDYNVLLVTGIANPNPLKKFLNDMEIKFKHIEFPDHHNFSERDIFRIKSEYNQITSRNKLILTTEKDFVRLNNRLEISYLKIKTKFIDRKIDFDKIITAYVEQGSGNG